MKKVIRMENGRTRVITLNNEPTKTQQQFKDQCDVNNIMKKYKLTGEWPNPKKQGIYLDSTNLPDYQSALNTVIAANDSFSTLPSDVRKRFSNDPAEMIKFLADPKNNEEAIKLGLKIKTQTTEPETATKPNATKPNNANKKTADTKPVETTDE